MKNEIVYNPDDSIAGMYDKKGNFHSYHMLIKENQELKDLLKKIHKQRYTAKNTYTQEYYDLTDEIGKLLKQELVEPYQKRIKELPEEISQLREALMEKENWINSEDLFMVGETLFECSGYFTDPIETVYGYKQYSADATEYKFIKSEVDIIYRRLNPSEAQTTSPRK